jgi:hypothetical protein
MVVNVQTVIANVNVIDVNVATSRITKDHVLQERKPRKNKSAIDWEKEIFLKKQW